MARDNSVIEKGSYLHRQSGAFVELKNFIISEKSGKRCLLLQFANNSQNEVTSIKFILVQLDASGKTISKQAYSYEGLKMKAERSFSLERGIVIKKECADFRLHMVYAVSGDYRYFFRNGRSVQSYDPRGYKEKKHPDAVNGTLQVKKTFGKSGRLHGFIAFIAVVMIFAACAYTALGYFL